MPYNPLNFVTPTGTGRASQDRDWEGRIIMPKMAVSLFFLAGSAAACLFAVAPAKAEAQDTGEEWINRITRELRAERDTVNAPMTKYAATAGVVVYHDDNVFLTEKDEKDDTVWVPFAELRIDYDDPNVDLAAALMADY